MHKFNLTENAKDSLLHAIDHMGPVDSNTPGDWKRIIVDLAHVLELLFKERLLQIHPAFVFKDVDKYPSSNAFTVGAELAVKRLQKIGHLVFSEDDLKAITSAREKRNEIEHYEFSIENKEAKVLVGQALAFILKFSETELKLEWSALCFENNKWYVLYQYKEFYESLLTTTNEKIDNEEIPVLECPSCHNETFDIEQEYCLLCGHKEEVLECVRCQSPYLYSVIEYEGAELCPKCEYDEGYASANFEKY
jgi:Zn finger protein HypA/HybF involved in hydrogenase expression